MAIRIPISNSVTQDIFTLALSVGAAAIPVNVIVDTGSSMLTVSGDIYDPATDTAVRTTTLLQTEQFGSAPAPAVAAVVTTQVGLLTNTGGGAAITVPNAALAVVRDPGPGLFGAADGVFGLAYPALCQTLQMPADTCRMVYTLADLGAGHAAAAGGTYLDQLVADHLAANAFALAVRRSVASKAADDAVNARLNTGLLVLGGGAEEADLFTGGFTSVAIVREDYYSTNLIAVRIGGRSIAVSSPPAGSVGQPNAIIDSGCGTLRLAPDLYQAVIDAFNAVAETSGDTLERCAENRDDSYDQAGFAQVNWPVMEFVFRGIDGGPATVVVAPRAYWQFDAAGPGKAKSRLLSAGAALNGRSILGLPLFTEHYVVFDRTGGPGLGAIRFADAAPLGSAQPGAPLVA